MVQLYDVTLIDWNWVNHTDIRFILIDRNIAYIRCNFSRKYYSFARVVYVKSNFFQRNSFLLWWKENEELWMKNERWNRDVCKFFRKLWNVNIMSTMFRSCFRANSIIFTRIRVIARHYGNTIVDNPFLHLASLKKFLGEPLVENRFDQASSLCPMFDAFFHIDSHHSKTCWSQKHGIWGESGLTMNLKASLLLRETNQRINPPII